MKIFVTPRTSLSVVVFLRKKCNFCLAYFPNHNYYYFKVLVTISELCEQ